MSKITGPLRGTGGLRPKPHAAGKLPDDLVKASAARAKEYLKAGGDPPADLVEGIAADVEAHLKSQGKPVNGKKLREGIRAGLIEVADRPNAQEMSDAELEGVARGGLTSLVNQMGGKDPFGVKGM